MVNVLHAHATGTGAITQTEIDAIATAYGDQFSSDIVQVFMNTGYTFLQSTATDLSSDTGLSGTAAYSDSGGVTGSAFLPSSVACCISWRQNNRYRGGHPRTYLGGMSDALTSDPRTWGSTFLSNLTTAANIFLANVNGVPTGGSLSWEMVMVRRIANKLVLVPPRIFAITSAQVDSRIDTQRRRLGKDVSA